MRAMVLLFFILIAGICTRSLFAANELEDRTPMAVNADSALSLDLFHSLKSRMEAAADAQALSDLQKTVREHQHELVAALHASQSIQRTLAAKLLPFAVERMEALKRLADVLANDADLDVRATAAGALAFIGDAAAVEPLVTGLTDSSEEVRGQCALALGALHDERAVPALQRLIRGDGDPELRLCAVKSLSDIGRGLNQRDLTALLDREGDERVRMALASLIRATVGGEDALPEVPEKDDFCKRLSNLAGEMKTVEGSLREDRHDQSVQWDQKEIERKLREMTSELENVANADLRKCGGAGQKKSRLLAALGCSEQAPRPGAQGALSSSRMNDTRLNAACVEESLESWARLPEKHRDELLQILRPEVPLRWRKRLEAYFVSIAAEEAARK